MDFLREVLVDHSAIQATIVMSMIIALGTALGKIKVAGISLGATFVFFVGIFAGSIGLSIDPQMLSFAQSFGLVLFVYEIGLQVGPGFFSSLKGTGIRLNIISIVNIFMGTAFAVALAYACGVPFGDMAGILCGAVTNTAALAAAQQTLSQIGIDASTAALGCAVTYPLGVVGVIIVIAIINKTQMGKRANHAPQETGTETFIATFQVKNPACFNQQIKDVVSLVKAHIVISRLWRQSGEVISPEGITRLEENDRLMVLTEEKSVQQLTMLFGVREENEDWNRKGINWDHLHDGFVSKTVIVTQSKVCGHSLGSLRLSHRYHVNVSRVGRMGLHLLATPKIRLQYGDRLTVVGRQEDIANVESELGNARNTLQDPNLASVFVGITLGLMLGCIPIFVPGVSLPVRLGLAGGPIIAGILMGAYGARVRLRTYTTRSSNLMLRGVGLSLYLACLGIASGDKFVETMLRPEGLMWVGLGFLLTVVPVFITAIWCLKKENLDLGTTYGMLCGSMANPMALTFADDSVEGDAPSVSYATVYPMGMFLRVVIIQVLVLFLCK